MENSGRESEITIKRQIERVGVSRRRERTFLSFKDVWRIPGRVNNYRAQRQKVTRVEQDKKNTLIPRLTHTLTYRHILSSYTLIHLTGIFLKNTCLKAALFLPCLVIAALENLP